MEQTEPGSEPLDPARDKIARWNPLNGVVWSRWQLKSKFRFQYMTEQITRPIVASELFARDVLREAGREDLYAWVSAEGLEDEVAEAIARLSILQGGVVADTAGKTAHTPDQLNALIGGTWHVNISKDGWKVAVHGVVLAISVLRASLGDLIEVGTIGVEFLLLVDEISRVVHRLKSDEVEVFLAVKAASSKQPTGATLDEIDDLLRSVTSDDGTKPEYGLQKRLEDLVLKGVLEYRDGKFRCL
jgi:hypothetical protein